MAAKTTYPTQPRLKTRKRRWYIYFLALFASFCLMTAGIVLYIMKVNPGSVRISLSDDTSLNGKSEFNVLVAGLDAVKGVNRTDSILVAHVNLKDKFVTVVSIPRDMRVDIPGRRHKDKINAAYVHGGPELLVETVEELLGTRVNYYAVFRLDAAKSVIDAMGGVDLDVEKRLRYRDRAQNLNIDLEMGMQHLDGDKAMQYARFRHDAVGDFGRIQRQQKLISALARKAVSMDMLAHLPKVIIELSKNNLVETNFTLGDIRALMKNGDEQFSRNIHAFMLPGEPQMMGGVSYVIPDEREIPYMVGGLLRGGFQIRNSHLNVSVKNGCGSPMLAQKYKQRLEYYGFEVLETENASDFDYDKTLVVVRKKTEFADAVARLLNAEKVSDLQPDSIVHLEVILGKDKLIN